MKLKKLYKLARREQKLARLCWANGGSAHSHFIVRRNALMDAIFAHPDNRYTKAAIACQIIDGLSGSENELKAA